MTIRSETFVQSIGVDQHIGWGGTPYANLAIAQSDLAYLGVTLVRDQVPAGYDMAAYQSLANAGVRFDLITSAAGQDLANTLPTDIANVVTLAQSNPGSVLSVEGPNELNGQIVYLNGASSADPATGAAMERAVSQAVRGNATLAAQGVKVVNVSITNGIGGWDSYANGLGNLSASVDYANWHVYFNNGDQPLSHITSMYQDALRSAPGKPVVFTESGYFTAYQDNSGWGGVDEATQAKNTLNLLADAYKAGVAQTYLYELMEGTANPSTTDIENTFGLFRTDGTAKPVATAIHNLTSILADPASNALTFATGTLNYSISNLPATGNSLLLEKASGVFDLMVWNEAPDWNPSTQSEIWVAPTNAVVNLGATFSSVKVFDPLQGGAAIQTLSNVSSVTLGLTDHPMIIEVAAGGTPIPSAKPSPDGTKITTASASPIIDQAGNAWTLVQSASQGLQIAVNGTVDASTSYVTLLETLGGKIVQENIAGNWYSEPGPNGPWTQIAAPVAAPAAVTTGSGSDTLVLTMSEDAYQGDAQFTVSVDGKQLGGTFTTTALHASGVGQTFTFKGDWAPGAHTAAVNFLNDAYGGTAATDRNLYVNAVSYDGPATGQTASFMTGGSKSFSLTDSTAMPGTTVSPPAPISTGSGSDTLVLTMSEDAYKGDAQFTVSVDGKQLAGTFTTTAPHASAGSQSFTFKGDWASGAHTVAVNFVNDAYGGTAATDRNLYMSAISYDGKATGQSASFMAGGTKNFSVTDTTVIPTAATGSGADTLVLSVSEDAYQGDAQFTVAVDGKQLGGTFTATASHAAGASQDLAFKGDFGSGQHTVAVNFVNDAWAAAGPAYGDRNLYVNAISYGGTSTGQSATMLAGGPVTFAVSGGTTPSVAETGDHGSLQQSLSQAGTYTVGGDTFVLSSGNAASVTLGTGTSQIKFIGASSVNLTGGSGQAVITADTGSNKFVAGTGSLDVTGGGGKDAYVFHANSGLLTLQDFSLAKGDTLTVDKALQGSLKQASDGQGGTMLTFGTTGHGVDIHGMAAMPSSNVLWA